MIKLENLWRKITTPNEQQIDFVRISADSVLELSVGINSSNNRCLVLELPQGYNSSYQTIIKKNLSLQVLDHEGYIVLELMDDLYHDLFNDLIWSLYQHVYDVSEIEKCEKIFIDTFYKWSNFFEDKQSDLLKQEVIKGLFGELYILKAQLLETSSTLLYDDILKSWRGPYDDGHDFKRDQVDIEVKTKEITKQAVNISSEYQLAEEQGKGLELLVLSVESNIENGKSIGEMLIEIKNILSKELCDISILYNALAQKNITIQNIDRYDNFRYIPIEYTLYNCCDDSFPRIIKANMPPAQLNVKYDLLVNELVDFIVSEKKISE